MHLCKKAGVALENQEITSSAPAEETAVPEKTGERPIQIQLQDVRKVYQVTGGEVVALDNINLSIRQGDIFGIIGLSGAGKSTLIRCINRLDTPTEGRVLINGENVVEMDKHALQAMRKRVGMIFQQFNLLMQKTVEKNISYPMEIVGMPRSEINRRVKELLAIVGLEDKAKVYPSQLSGGQRQRVAIARTLATNPEVLLCDEATSALDPMTTQSILKLLQDINRSFGITVVIITHEMAVIRQICTHVAIMDNGRIAEEGSVDEVFTHTRSQAGRRLFGILPEEQLDIQLKEPAVRVVFDGAKVAEPIIADLILKLGIPVSILSADVRHLNGAQYGQMILTMPDDYNLRRSAMDFLREKGLTVEEVINL